MKELVLPTASSEEEIECIIELAKEMGLTVERGDKVNPYYCILILHAVCVFVLCMNRKRHSV